MKILLRLKFQKYLSPISIECIEFQAFDGVTVEYMTVPGWKTSITECKTFDSLPANAKDYINKIEDFLHIPGIISYFKNLKND